jgi:hypothetical protein
VKRRLLNLLTALSLLLCVAICVLWVRGHWFRDSLMFTWASGRALIRDARGHVEFMLTLGGDWSEECGVALLHKPRPSLAQELVDEITEVTGPRYGSVRRWWGVQYLDVRYRDPWRSWHVLVVPCWQLVIAFAALPVAWSIRRVRRRHPVSGLCPMCGYDLRATPGRCPECGTNYPRAKP